MQQLVIIVLTCYTIIMVFATIGAYVDYTDRHKLVSKRWKSDVTYKFTAYCIQLSLALIALGVILWY